MEFPGIDFEGSWITAAAGDAVTGVSVVDVETRRFSTAAAGFVTVLLSWSAPTEKEQDVKRGGVTAERAIAELFVLECTSSSSGLE